jgi:hypothetical protein
MPLQPPKQPGLKPVGPPKPPSLGENNEFDLARRRAQQQESQNLGAQKDALARRAAQLGGGVSGALIKQEQIATDESAKRLGQANEGIDAAQRQEQRRIDEIAQGQEFMRSEREATQSFASGERKAGEKFAQTQLATQLTAQKDMQARQIKAAAEEGRLTREQADKQLNELSRQFDMEFQENLKTNYINSVISAHNSGIKPEDMRRLLDEIGVGFTPDGRMTFITPDIPGVTGAANVDRVGTDDWNRDVRNKTNPNVNVSVYTPAVT